MSQLEQAQLSPQNLTHNGTLFQLQPEELVQIALRHLSESGIRLIEWHSLLYRHFQVPIFAKARQLLQFHNFSYIIPDDQLSRSSRLLADLSLAKSSPDPFHVRTGGDVYTEAHLYRLTASEGLGAVQYLALFPESYVSFYDWELSPHPGSHFHNVNIFIPRPAALYAALIRLISSYPRPDCARHALITELGMLIMYHLYPQHDEDSEENDAADIEHALDMIRGWWEDWRYGEEWIRDTLIAMAQTGDVEHLPWSASPDPAEAQGLISNASSKNLT
ncbi:hypothetical protein C8R45DRAFT_818703 [Mycena sanguinolenta]|nr:hypothetical protein C8R45DRAFT_818703 [Mycena sanguinolenta]